MTTARIPSNAEHGWGNDFRALLQALFGFTVTDPTYGGGADPTGAADATAALAAAITAVDTTGNDRGGRVLLPRGLFKTSGVTFSPLAPNIPPIHFVGEAAGLGNITGSTGTNIVPDANSRTLMTFGDTVGPTPAAVQEGVTLERMNFYANTFTGCTGLKVTGYNHSTFTRLGFKDLSVGMLLAGKEPTLGATDSAWNTLLDCAFYNNLVAGLKTYDAFGAVILAGDFNISDPGSGQAYGLYITGGASEATQSLKAFGAFFDSQNHPSAGRVLGAFIERGHECLILGTKFEKLDTGAEITNLDGADSTAGAMNVLAFCTVVADAGDIGFQIDANASDTLIVGPSMSSVGTGIVNNGARTKVFGGRLDVTTPISGTEPELFGVTFPDGGTGRFSRTRLQGPFARKRVTLSYGSTVSTDCSKGNLFTVTATNATPFTIAAPTQITNDQEITYTIRNTSGGALGAITWNAAFKMVAFTSPTNGNSCSISFVYDGTNWIQITPQTVQVPN